MRRKKIRSSRSSQTRSSADSTIYLNMSRSGERIYVATSRLTGSAPFSWAVAMDSDPGQVAMMKAFLAETNDERILAGPRGQPNE
jgi:hypothetical protein